MTRLVWLTSRRDLRYRRRRLVIAVVATTMAFALTLLLSGFRDGIDLEVEHTLAALSSDAFLVQAGARGPFTTTVQVDTRAESEVLGIPGVEDGAAVVTVRHSIESPPITDVYLVGARPGAPGMATVRRGRAPRASGEAALDAAAGRRLGQRVRLAGRQFRVVGLLQGVTVWAGVPAMFVTLQDAQQIVFRGLPAATAIAVRGAPRGSLPGLRLVSRRAAVADLKRPLANAITTIDLFRIMLWLVAAAIVGAVLYISSLERSRDFAVFKAFGTGNADLVGTLVVEAVILAAVSAVAAVALSRPLARLFPAVISFPATTLLLVPAVAVAVGLAGSLAGARRAVAVDPALAFASQ